MEDDNFYLLPMDVPASLLYDLSGTCEVTRSCIPGLIYVNCEETDPFLGLDDSIVTAGFELLAPLP